MTAGTTNSTVVPSAGDLAAASWPTLPPAPPRFSTTLGCPVRSASLEDTMRVTTSAGPPGGNGTIQRIGFDRSEERRVGKECRSRCDWSSDVCSSDLIGLSGALGELGGHDARHHVGRSAWRKRHDPADRLRRPRGLRVRRQRGEQREAKNSRDSFLHRPPPACARTYCIRARLRFTAAAAAVVASRKAGEAAVAAN